MGGEREGGLLLWWFQLYLRILHYLTKLSFCFGCFVCYSAYWWQLFVVSELEASFFFFFLFASKQCIKLICFQSFCFRVNDSHSYTFCQLLEWVKLEGVGEIGSVFNYVHGIQLGSDGSIQLPELEIICTKSWANHRILKHGADDVADKIIIRYLCRSIHMLKTM